jgi:RNA polymerase sigma factor (sigma-70 family)
MKAVSSPTSATNALPTAGSQGKWRERSARLYSEFEPAARRMVRRAFRGAFGEDELDDIYSNAWLGTLRALEPRHAELTDDEIRSYVFAAVAHQAGREIRRRKRKPTAPLDAAFGRPDAGPTPDERAVSRESSQVTRDLLASLPPRRRSVMLLRYGWGLDPQQVCSLIKGLSPRAYRKEITRGVDELSEKVRAFERGEWCVERRSALKAYAAGIADVEEARQAQAHLSHCRGCNDLVARLNGHLHELGGTALAPSAIDGLNGDISWTDRLTDLPDRAREGIASMLGRAPSGAPDEAAAALASSGGARGAGVAGAGVLAKLAGAGAAGKVALACAGGGVAATACIAAGVGPIDVGGESQQVSTSQEQSGAGGIAEQTAHEAPIPTPETLPAQIESSSTVATPTGSGVGGDGQGHPDGEEAAVKSTDASDPVDAEAPSATQEFGAPAAAAPAAPAPVENDSGAESSDPVGSSGPAVRQEFTP